MKLELIRKDFLKSWQLAERFTAAKSSADYLQGVFITAADDGQVTLEATDLKISVKCKAHGVNVVEAGKAVASIAILGDMLRKAEADNLMLDINSERGFLNAGKSKTKFAVIPLEKFPNIPKSSDGEKNCTIKADDLRKLINEGGSASSIPTDFPKYYGTCLFRTQDGQVKIVATDGKRLSLSQKACENIENEIELLLPAPALKNLARIFTGDKEVQISANDSTIWFSFDDVEFSIRLVEALFPKYENILNNVIETSMKIKTEDLMPVLERISIISRTQPANIMTVSLNPNGEMKILAQSPEAGATIEELNAEISGNSMLIGFNVGYFMDGLKALGQGEINIEFSGVENQARMKRGDFLYMLMPARLSSDDIAYYQSNIQ